MDLSSFATWFYGVMSSLMCLAYLPTIYMMVKTKESDSSGIGWIIWWVGSIASTLYASIVVKQDAFILASLGHFVGTSIILMIQIHKRPKKPSSV